MIPFKFLALAAVLNAAAVGGIGMAWHAPASPAAPVYRLPDVVVVAQRPQAPVCIAYETPVTLTGSVVWVKAYGPPGWGKTPKQDADESYLKLILPAPICTLAGDIVDTPETGVTELQVIPLFFDPDRTLAGHRVQITGSLTHSQTRHQRTDVTLEINSNAAVKVITP
jgi:hypothetical protein